MFQGGGKARALRKLSCKNSIVLGEPLYLKAFPHNTNVTNVCPLETCYVARRMAYPRRWGSRVGHDSSRHRLQPVTAIKPTQFPTQHIPPASPAMRTYGSVYCSAFTLGPGCHSIRITGEARPPASAGHVFLESRSQ